MPGVKVPGATASLPFNDTLGETIPPDTAHAVSVSLPTWRSNVGYEEGEKWVTEKMQCGYPRFFIHKKIQRFAERIVAVHGSPETEQAMLVPTPRCAARCKAFLLAQHADANPATVKCINFGADPQKSLATGDVDRIQPKISAVIYPKECWPAAKAFWQHTGEGVQSRRAEFCHRAFEEGRLVAQSSASPPETPTRMSKGPRRYQRQTSVDQTASNGPLPLSAVNGRDVVAGGDGVLDSVQFVEERFGRNLSVKFAEQAKLAIRRRIAGSLTANTELPHSLDEPADAARARTRTLPEFSVEDVYLFSCGMNAIFTSHRLLRIARGEMKSIMFGFPYVDTLKVLEKFGPGVNFYGHADASDLDELENRLRAGERYLALYCEFPGNPLLKTPDLKRIRSLADRYDFAVVVDETIGNFLNVHVLPCADVVVSSLTKIFSGDGNVMGGAMIFNPRSKWYTALRHVLASEYEDNMFEEDSVYLERNSRDFVDRIRRVNLNAEAVADVLRACPKVKQVNYPKYSPTKEFYDAFRVPDGGYGGLLSATFHSVEHAAIFYDHLNTHKGPSLGTNFTLSSPFIVLAHYGELDWAAQFGCEASLVRFSIGLEDTEELVKVFQTALHAIPDST